MDGELWHAWQKRRYHSVPFGAGEHAAYKILQNAPIGRIESVWFDHKLEDLLDALTKAGK